MRRTFLLAAGLIVAAPHLVLAQDATAFPTKPVRILVPLAPGGGVDTVARKLADKLKPALKQPIIVENKPGAAGTLAIDTVAKAPPDGHTIALVAGSMIAINPHVLRQMPYDTAKDLVPVAQVGTTPLVLLVNANNPAKTLKEFLAAAKAKPKEASFGSYGNASVGHLLGEAIAKAAGVDMVHVPYKGATPAINDLSVARSLRSWPTSAPPVRTSVKEAGCARSRCRPTSESRRTRTCRPSAKRVYRNSTP